MSDGLIVLRDAAGRRRSRATMPGYLAGRAPRSLLCLHEGAVSVIHEGAVSVKPWLGWFLGSVPVR